MAKLFKSGFILLVLVITACAPPRYSYQDQVGVKLITTGKIVKTRVSAQVEDWRNAGIQVTAHSKYKITAKGKWRTFGTCNFTDPDGIGLYTGLCFSTPYFHQ